MSNNYQRTKQATRYYKYTRKGGQSKIQNYYVEEKESK